MTTPERPGTDPEAPGPVTVTLPAELADDVLAWVEDRAACSAAEDDPHQRPWWEGSDDTAADLAHRLADVVKDTLASRD